MFEFYKEPAIICQAREFAIRAHGVQKYGDKPYSYHLTGVARLVKARNQFIEDEAYFNTLVVVAWLHDVLEDTPVTYQEVANEFGIHVADAVHSLTKYPGLEWEHYIMVCKLNKLALEVKICDTLFNLQESFLGNRLKGMRKYPKQLQLLTGGL